MSIIILTEANNKVRGELKNFMYCISKDIYFGNLNKRIIDLIITEIIIKNKASANIIVEAKNEQGFEIITIGDNILYNNNGIWLTKH